MSEEAGGCALRLRERGWRWRCLVVTVYLTLRRNIIRDPIRPFRQTQPKHKLVVLMEKLRRQIGRGKMNAG